MGCASSTKKSSQKQLNDRKNQDNKTFNPKVKNKDRSEEEKIGSENEIPYVLYHGLTLEELDLNNFLPIDFKMTENIFKMETKTTKNTLVIKILSVDSNEKEIVLAFKKHISLLNQTMNKIYAPAALAKYYGYYMEEKKNFKTFNIYLFFEYDSFNLKLLINENKQSQMGANFEVRVLLKIFYRILYCLVFLQICGFSNHDLKPENLFYNQTKEEIRVFNIGVPKVLEFHNKKTKNAFFSDAKLYNAPETIQEFPKDSEKTFNTYKSDVFSFGIIIYELVTMEIIKNSSNQKEIDEKLKILREKTTNICPLELEKDFVQMIDLLEKCLKIDPLERYDFIQLYKMLFKTRDLSRKETKRHFVVRELDHISEIEFFLASN